VSFNLTYVAPTLLGEDIAKVNRALLKLSNTTAVTQVFSRIRRKFYKLWNKRSFFYWYVMEVNKE